MEGGSSNVSNECTDRTTASGTRIAATADIPEGSRGDAGASQHLQQPNHDPSLYLPMSNIVQNMRRVLPPQAKIADDAKETVQECVSQFINLVTDQALDRCHRECRSTITPDDVVAAMGTLGFGNYTEALSVFLSRRRSPDTAQASSIGRQQLPAQPALSTPPAEAQPPPTEVPSPQGGPRRPRQRQRRRR